MLGIYTSTVTDGSMKSPGQDFSALLLTRAGFLEQHGIAAHNTTLVQLTYESSDFCRYATLADNDKGDGIVREATIVADALVVTKTGHALLLPLADCIGAVVHDPAQNILMVSHLGRHNLEQIGGTKCIEYLVRTHGCDPASLTVWLSPAAGKDAYPLYSFNNRSLHDVAIEQLYAAGISANNLTASPINSASDPLYFSHSKYLRGDQDTDGRHAIVAVLKD